MSKSLSDGTLASYTFDAANRITTLNHTLSGTSFTRFDYGYDTVNRRTYEQRDSASGDTYGYDAVDQVTGVNYDAANPTSSSSGADRTVGYTYDAGGNRTAVNDSVNGNAGYSANNLNQYSTVAGAAYAYDANGNLITGNGLYTYDAQNRLDYAQVASNTDQFSYDSRNRVVERTVNGTPLYLIYNGWDLIEERDGSNNVLTTYVHGVRQDEMLTKTTSAGTVYYHHNALGSVADLTNAGGAVVEKYKYDAFGKPAITDGSGNPLTASAYGNRFLFTGREYLAEVNLYDYRNRVYSADLGRFLQTDPLRFSAADVNIYRYCGNNPINGTDAMGLVTGQGISNLDCNDSSGAYDANGNSIPDDGSNNNPDSNQPLGPPGGSNGANNMTNPAQPPPPPPPLPPLPGPTTTTTTVVTTTTTSTTSTPQIDGTTIQTTTPTTESTTTTTTTTGPAGTSSSSSTNQGPTDAEKENTANGINETLKSIYEH